MSEISNRVFIDRFEHKSEIYNKIQAAFAWLGELVKPGDSVFIKPNLTYPFYKPGVTTSPEFMEAVVKVLKDTTDNITFVESDGGAYAWPADQAMAGHKIPDLCKRYGIKMMNLTERPRREVTREIAGREVTVELSAEMLDQSDLFITMPVPKMHVMTYLTLGFKNQWGCLPDVKRLRNHPDFDHKILAINQALRTRVAVFDGTYFLNRTGPMDGDPVQKNLVIVSDGIGAGSLVCCELLGISPWKAGHLRLAQKIGMMPKHLADVALNCDLETFLPDEPFHLHRTWINYITLMAFRSSLLTRIVYDSAFAKPIHELLYLIRGRPDDVHPEW